MISCCVRKRCVAEDVGTRAPYRLNAPYAGAAGDGKWRIDPDDPATFGTYFVVRAIDGAETGGRFKVSVSDSLKGYLRVVPSISEAYVAPGKGQGFTVMLFAENNFPVALKGEVVIKSIDCGVETVVPVTIEASLAEPVCGDAMMTVRSQAGNWKQLKDLRYEDSIQEPFAGISHDKITAVHRATLSMRFENKRPGDDELPSFSADVSLNNYAIGSGDVSTGSDALSLEIQNRKNTLLPMSLSPGRDDRLGVAATVTPNEQSKWTFFNRYVVPTDVRLETTFSFEQCLMVPGTSTVNEYLASEGLVPAATAPNDGFCNSAMGEDAASSPLDCGCLKSWVSGLTRHRERGGMQVDCGPTHVVVDAPRDEKWLGGGEGRTSGTGRVTELASLSSVYGARNVVEDEILCLSAPGEYGSTVAKMENSIRFTNVTLHDSDRRGIRETVTSSYGVTGLRIERRLFPAYDAAGTGILVSDLSITNAHGSQRYTGELVVGLRLKPRYRTGDAGDYAVDGAERYATVVAGGDYPGETPYRVMLGVMGPSPGGGCWSATSEPMKTLLADSAGVAATFTVDVPALNTRHYVLFYVPPFAEDANLDAIYSQRLAGHTFTCSASWDASYNYHSCDLDTACEAPRETADACPAECGTDSKAAPAGFLASAGDGVCGEGERLGNATDFRDAKDCGCGPSRFCNILRNLPQRIARSSTARRA